MSHTQIAIDLRDSKEIAALLGISIESLIRWRQRGEGPPLHRIGPRKIAYDMNDVAAWLRSRRQCPKTNRFVAGTAADLASEQGAM